MPKAACRPETSDAGWTRATAALLLSLVAGRVHWAVATKRASEADEIRIPLQLTVCFALIGCNAHVLWAGDAWGCHILDCHNKAASSFQVGIVSDRVHDGLRANAEASPAGNRAGDTVHTPVVAGSRSIPADDGGWSSGGRIDGDGSRASDRWFARVLHSDCEGAGGLVPSIIGRSSSHLAKQSNQCNIVIIKHIPQLTVDVDPTAKLLPDVLL